MSESAQQLDSNKIASRRLNRETTIQFLYMWELNRPEDLNRAIAQFMNAFEKPREHYSFAESLIQGTLAHITEIDELIKQHAQNWSFSRIGKVDLSILRLAIYELLHRKDIPPIVSINEAIDLGKIYSSADSKRFINGILDKIKDTLDRPLRSTDA